MLKIREQANVVPTSNPYVFANHGSANRWMAGYHVIRKLAAACGAKRPTLLTSTRFRKHIATTLQLMAMDDSEMKQIATFMGHSKKTHSEYYRLPQNIFQTAKVAKVLMLLEKGKEKEFKGKLLSELEFENDVYISSESNDEEDVSKIGLTDIAAKPSKLDETDAEQEENDEYQEPCIKKGRIRWSAQEKNIIRIKDNDYQNEYKKQASLFRKVMDNAIQAVRNGMSPFKAHKTLNVPRTTLLDKLHGRSLQGRKIGAETILTGEEENILVKWMMTIAEQGFPATKLQLIDSVQILIKNLKRENPFKDGRPGRHWFEGFMRRHPELTRRNSQNLTNARANVTEEKIRKWFMEINSYLLKNNFLHVTNKPQRVFNCDESSFFLSPKNDKVLAKKGERTVYSFINNDEKECLTTLLTCNAAGQFASPMVVYSYQRVSRNIVEKVPASWGIGRSDNGWMTEENFF
ncbi:unnamed protein product [Diabrotica balteata]|uniref:HTH CENPB-type domain-containing protein n=1 Tax=Diabrotica balteata TaxID=107213 RepID=A0A9N9T8D8_DIABA|nr:unnamed protein product [Diabrotica balteata]